MPSEPFNPDLNDLARRLSAMPLASAALSRDRLMFLAGQATEARRRRGRYSAAAMVLTTLGLTAGFFLGRSFSGQPTMVVERVVRIPAEAPAPPAPSVPPPAAARSVPSARATEEPAAAPEDISFYLAARFRLERQLLGHDQGPRQPFTAVEAPPPLQVEELLGLPFGTLDPVDRRRWQSALHPGDPS